jgi:hypothetical protein
MSMCLVTGLVMTGVAAPTASQAAPIPAAPSASSVPTNAFLRVDGGTAYATQTGEHRYTVRLPKGTGVRWLGEARGKSNQFGTMSPSRLAGSWQRLGHRPGVGVQSSITWRAKGTDYTSFADARVSDPRIDGKGDLVFTARTPRGSLPAVLPDFSFNIAPAERSARKYPIDWGAWPVAQVVGFDLKATADTAGTLTWVYNNSPGKWVPCYGVPVTEFGGPTPANVSFGGFTCNSITMVNAPTNYVAWTPMTSASGSKSAALPCYTLKVTSSQGTSTLPACSTQTFTWQAGGNNPFP